MITAEMVRQEAAACGFALAGIAPMGPYADHDGYMDWVQRGLAGRMGYLTDHRAVTRADVRTLLPEARSVLVVGQLYNPPEPYSTAFSDAERGWISRYAWGADYHDTLRAGLERLVAGLTRHEPFAYKICVDTAPVLERSLARLAGLGWIGKNTCLINQQQGSWFFLGEVIWSLDLAADAAPPDRCGTCTRCIDACPTAALAPRDGRFELDARLCIAYLNIELKGPVPEELRTPMGRHLFGCDICQDVCPWNRRAAALPAFDAEIDPPLERMAALTREEFSALFAGTPVERTRYQGFLRNVCIAMGNAALPRFRAPLERLAASDDIVIEEHARWALARL